MLHGWGANCRDLAPLASMMKIPDCQFIFPDAPFPHPQVPGGKAWYALETQEYRGLAESRQILDAWLQSLPETTGIPLDRTVLAGFSQGGAMTLDVGLNLSLAGLCVMSGYLHSQPQAQNLPLPPVSIVHGKQDPVVPIAAARQTKDALTAIGAKVLYREFDMGHEISLEALSIIESFILQCFSG